MNEDIFSEEPFFDDVLGVPAYFQRRIDHQDDIEMLPRYEDDLSFIGVGQDEVVVQQPIVQKCNETLFDDEVTKALLNGINNQSITNPLVDHINESIQAFDGSQQQSFGSGQFIISQSFQRIQESITPQNDLSCIMNSREDQRYSGGNIRQNNTNSIDESICLEESFLLDDSSFQVPASREQGFHHQLLEDLLLQPDYVDPETFLKQKGDDVSMLDQGSSTTTDLKHSFVKATSDGNSPKDKKLRYGLIQKQKHLNNSFQSLKRLQKQRPAADKPRGQSLNKSLAITSSKSQLIQPQPKQSVYAEIFQMQKIQQKQLKLPERILEEIDSLSGASSSEKEIKQKSSEVTDDKLTKKKYDFLYKRTCFRLMADFFKSLFQTMHKGKKVSRNYQKCIDEFAAAHFGPHQDTEYRINLSDESLRQLYGSVLLVTQAHRHNLFQEGQLDSSASLSLDSCFSDVSAMSVDSCSKSFSLVRDVLYKYSKAAQERFFQNEDLAFLYIWFQNHPQSRSFLDSKLASRHLPYKQRIFKDLQELGDIALNKLLDQYELVQEPKITEYLKFAETARNNQIIN